MKNKVKHGTQASRPMLLSSHKIEKKRQSVGEELLHYVKVNVPIQ